MNKQPIIRNQDGSYDVLSSNGLFYYRVLMLAENAVDCECAHFNLGHATCKHMRAAEAAFQAQQGEPPKYAHASAPLNGDAGFSLLK